MAYFDCIVGGASGDGVALIIECDSSFAGSVITADNGEDVFTDTCPSVAPYTVKFDGIPTGTYTISGVSGGETVTKQFTVLDYTVPLHVIPDGATVTPVDDIQIWLHCANIWDKSYTTIAQVLADASTLQALIASNNAADYMARSTTWASSVTANANAMTYIGNNNYCANKLLANTTWLNAICNSAYFESVLNVKVPTMTSNTAPRGEAYSSSNYSGAYPFYVFDGKTTLPDPYSWQTALNSNGGYVAYDFTNSVKVNKVTMITDGIESNATTTYTVRGSNSKTSGWVDLVSYTHTNSSTTMNKSLSVPNNNGYRYYSVYGTSNRGTVFRMVELQFYGRSAT